MDQPTTQNCHHCDGKGFIELRDCTGEVQREETCVFCGGTGTIASPTQKTAHPETTVLNDR